MKNQTIKEFNDSLSWEVRIFVLLSIAMVAGVFLFETWQATWSVAALFALIVVVGVEVFSNIKDKHPTIWRLIVWGIVLLMLAMLSIGARSMIN